MLPMTGRTTVAGRFRIMAPLWRETESRAVRTDREACHRDRREPYGCGVHGRGNVAVFDTDSPIPPDRIAYALNGKLPEDIVVVKSEEVPGDWHPAIAIQ